jgi:hypothetical protein
MVRQAAEDGSSQRQSERDLSRAIARVGQEGHSGEGVTTSASERSSVCWVSGVLVGGLVVLGTVVAVAVAVSRWVRARNEVCPRRRTGAPGRWLMSPERAARLHRRLRDAVADLRAVVPAPPRRQRPADLTVSEALAADLEGRAVSLDRELLVAARRRRDGRREACAGLAPEVVRLEAMARRLASTEWARRRSGAPVVDHLGEMARRLDALDAAWAELARVEHPERLTG